MCAPPDPPEAPLEAGPLAVLYHCTSPHSLKLIFRYGLYLSSETFTVMAGEPPLDWTRDLVALAFYAPKYRIHSKTSQLGIGFPEPLVFPPGLRSELEALNAMWVDGDQRVDSSDKSRELRAAVNGARNILIDESRGTLRHFPLTTFALSEIRRANRFGRYRAWINAYVDELETNGGKPLIDPVRPRAHSRISAFLGFHILHRWKSRRY